MRKEKEMDKIIEILRGLEETIKSKNSIGMFDLNKYCEDFYCELLNIVYGYKLSNANFQEKNAKYIDLCDKDNKVCVQVTSRKDAKKIYNTLEKFNDSNMVNDYDRLIFFLIAGKGENIKPSKTKGGISFDIEKDIKSNDELLEDIYQLSDSNRYKVFNYLIDQTSDNPILFDFSNLDKPTYDITNEYIDRKVSLASKYDSYFYKDECYEKLEDANRLNKQIVLLSDAGFGKSELCKNVANIINSRPNECAFYYRLNIYTNSKINDLKPKTYKKVPNTGITFILDAYDEIEDVNKNTFLKKLIDFISNYPDTRIIISCRTNFFKNNIFSDTFKIYNLTEFTNNDIRLILNNKRINYDNFDKEISNKNLSHFLKIPFYLFKIVSKYEIDNALPDKKKLIKDLIIDTFNFDESKHIVAKDIEEDRKRLYTLLGIVGLCMECLGRNHIKKDELSKIISNEKDRKLLEYSGIWLKIDDRYEFTHNNFGEFLASEILKEFSLEDIKKLVTYESDRNEIKQSWMNTLSFLLDSYENEGLKKWILDVYPDGICYLEKNDFDETSRESIFKRYFETYENKKISLPIEALYENDNFIDFISSKKTVEYLMQKIKENEHSTTVYNSLSLLMSFQNFYCKCDEMKNLLLKLSVSDYYTSQAKRYAMKILADNELINENDLFGIIEKNMKQEDSYIRISYFYVLGKLELTQKSIQFIFEKIDTVYRKFIPMNSNHDVDENNDLNLLDEQIQFDKLFLYLSDNNIFESVIIKIEELKEKEILQYLSEEMIRNICISFKQLFSEKKSLFELIFRLYVVLSNNYNSNALKVIADELDAVDLRTELFKRFINLDEEIRYFSDYSLINNKCLEHFIEEYENQKYSNDLAKELLVFSDIKFEGYNKLNSLYYERTGINYLEKRNKTISDGCFRQDYFNILFDVNDFVECFNEFKIETKIVDVTGTSLKKIDYNVLEYNEKFQEMRRFLLRFKSDKIITDKDLWSLNWDEVILNECYNLLTKTKSLTVSKKQEHVIYGICMNYLSNISFENAIKYEESGKGFTTTYMHIYLWYFRNKFNFIYPANVLLDMLDFDYSINEFNNIGIGYIMKQVSANKVKNRIVSNINEKIMYDDVLKNHVNYCIKEEIRGLSEFLIKYILDNELFTYGKKNIIEYILFDSGVHVLTDVCMNDVNFETEMLIIKEIFDVNKDALSEYLVKKIQNEEVEKKIIVYSRYLIKCNNQLGLQKYYEILLKYKKDIDTSYNENLREALSEVNNYKLLDLILKMYLLSFDKEYKDSSLNSLYSGCKNAIINIGLSNTDEFSYFNTIKKLEKIIKDNEELKNIGSTYYIIDELKQKYYQSRQPKNNIIRIVDELNIIFMNNNRSKGIVV